MHEVNLFQPNSMILDDFCLVDYKYIVILSIINLRTQLIIHGHKLLDYFKNVFSKKKKEKIKPNPYLA